MVIMGVAMFSRQLSAFALWLLKTFPVLSMIGRIANHMAPPPLRRNKKNANARACFIGDKLHDRSTFHYGA